MDNEPKIGTRLLAAGPFLGRRGLVYRQHVGTGEELDLARTLNLDFLPGARALCSLRATMRHA